MPHFGADLSASSLSELKIRRIDGEFRAMASSLAPTLAAGFHAISKRHSPLPNASFHHLSSSCVVRGASRCSVTMRPPVVAAVGGSSAVDDEKPSTSATAEVQIVL